MTVGYLIRMLTKDTQVIIKDNDTGKTIWTGEAVFANFNDTVKSWDFSKEHIVYI